MAVTYWRDDCKTHHRQIDADHRDLFNILAQLHRSILLEPDGAEVEAILDHLFNAAIAHCEAEEALMEIYAYPNASAHTEQHEALLAKILRLRLGGHPPEATLSIDLTHDLAQWLSHHIWAYDLELVQFVQNQQQPNRCLDQSVGLPHSELCLD
ncbi:bacteriohemerythrin [Leptolyngbya sp. CCNP1308]|uniref:bacteriohemerythrin n=1 Tax=Leptolyngbya sp. CCNP1308 TaxID=3110255 RepID=UPI002B206362|nr:bacteriohemerythrin [Leptolyngbya sp. CCNP1308]MEA5448727.1 bacteriohemerythrin [Leptolyngbya sp. CCNP1308]